MALNFDPLAYMRFVVLLSPVILPVMAIFGSLYEGNLKGFLYVLGLTISMAFGGMISGYANRLVPHTGVEGGTGTKGSPDGPFSPLIDPACNLIGVNDRNGWGTMYSMPGPHALLISFTLTYVMFPMFIYGNVNLGLLAGLIFLGIYSAILRTNVMNCVGMVDIMAGWGTGIILGSLWYFLMQAQSGGALGDTIYFSSTKSDKQECKLDKKAFRCKNKQKAQ
jgi:hypothetical protein